MLIDTLTVLLAASAIPLAAAGPTRVQRRDYHTFSLSKRLPDSYKNMTISERLEARREYEYERHLAKRQTANIPLTAKQSGSLWTMTPLLSATKTPAEVQLDTGSADLWSNAYTPTPGATQVGTTGGFSITYADGDSATGTCYTDRVEAGGLVTSAQTVCAATGSAAKQGTNTGLIGFGFQLNSAASPQAVPFVQNLKTAGAISRAMFGLRLTLTNAELYIGGTDNSRIAPGYTLQESSILPDGNGAISEWDILMTAVNVGSRNILGAPIKALMDSGTTQIIGPAADIQAFYAAIPGSMTLAAYNAMTNKPAPSGITTGYVLPCGGDSGGAGLYSRGVAVSLNLAGTAWKIPYSSLTTQNSDYTQLVNGVQYCDGTFSILNNNNNWIIGDYFLSNMYMEFDYDQSKVRLAYGQ